jgi:hypothetical protein
VRADFASRWAAMCGYLIFTLFAPCYIIGNAHHTSEEAFSMSIMSMPKTSPADLIYNYSMQSPRVPDCRYDNPWLQSKLAKSHIYAPLVSNCTCLELVYKWTLYLQYRIGISILEASFFFLFFIKLSTAATDLRLMQRLII